jgi:hypothetical protein
MLALTRKLGGTLGIALGLLLVSCASEKHVALVDDPDAKKESSVPWNKPEKWENSGPLSGLSDRR